MPIEDFSRASFKTETDPLFHVRDAAIGAGLLAALIYYFEQDGIKHKIDNLFDGNLDIVFLMQILTLLMLTALAVNWYYHGTEELKKLQEWLRPGRYRPQHPIAQYYAIIGVGIFMAFLGVFAQYIHIFAVAFALYLVLDLASWKLRREEISAGIARSRANLQRSEAALPTHGARLKEDRRRLQIYGSAADHLEAFYLKRPHYLRLTVEMGLMVLVSVAIYLLRMADIDPQAHAGLAALFARLSRAVASSDVDVRLWLRAIFYVFFATVLLGSELLIGRWRHAMSSALRDLGEELDLLDDDSLPPETSRAAKTPRRPRKPEKPPTS